MTTFVALLRAVNVGGSPPVAMTALRDLAASLKFQEVRTFLQTGNLVFRVDRGRPNEHEGQLESALERKLGLRTAVFVRTDEEWRSIEAHNPFPRAAIEDPSHLVVTTLKRAPSPDQWDALRAAIRGREEVRPGGREAFITYPDGIGRSKLTARVIETALGTAGTSRNWNTVTKLAALTRTLSTH